jgi:hypothetical protein
VGEQPLSLMEKQNFEQRLLRLITVRDPRPPDYSDADYAVAVARRHRINAAFLFPLRWGAGRPR